MKRLLIFPLLCLVAVLGGCDNTTAPQHLSQAQVHFDSGDYASADLELKNALQKDPRLIGAHALLGQVRFIRGDLEGALLELNRALDLGDTNPETKVGQLRVKSSLGQYNEVIGELSGQSGLSQAKAAVLGDAYIRAEDTTEARNWFGKALGVKEGLLGMAQVSAMENDTERGLSYIDKALAMDPTYRDGLLFKGELLLMANEPDQAAVVFGQAAELPGGQLLGKLGEVRALLVAEQPEEALVAVDRLISKNKKFVHAHYLKGLIQYRRGEWALAEESLFNVEKVSKEHLPTLQLMASVKYQLGRKDEAERRLRKYLDEDPTEVNARKLLATIVHEKGNVKEAIELLEPIALQYSDPQIWALLGSAYLRDGDAGAATEAFESAVALAPDMAPFRNQLALSLLSSGEDSRAKVELSNAIELGNDQFESDYLLAMVRVRDGDFAGAHEVVKTLIAKDPDSALGYNLQGSVFYAQGKLNEARTAFNQALAAEPLYYPAAQGLVRMAQAAGDQAEAERVLAQLSEQGSEQATLGLIDLKVASQQFNEALQLTEQAVQNFPESVAAVMGLSRLKMGFGDLPGAQAAAEQALTLSERSPDALLLSADIALRQGRREDAQGMASELDQQVQSQSSVQAQGAMGTLHMRLGNYTCARTYLDKIDENSPQTPNSFILAKARLEVQDKNGARAQRYLDALVARGLKSEQLALLQGDIYTVNNQMGAALRQFESLAKQGSRTGAIRALTLQLQEGENAKAEQLANQWLQDNPDDSVVQSLRATALVHMGKTVAAREQYEAMLPSNDPVVLNNLAWIYHVEGHEDALKMAEKANRLAPGNADIEDTLGWILVQSGDYEQGLKYLQASAKGKPSSGAVQYHLGIAYQKTGQTRKARRALETALRYGGFDDVEAARLALQEVDAQG